MTLLLNTLIHGLIGIGLSFDFCSAASAQSELDSVDVYEIAAIDYEIDRARKICIPTTTAIPWDDMTALQKHLAFFDFNSDAKVSLGETYRGLRILNLASALALPAAISINAAMATATAGHPSLTLRIRSIEGAIHGSDTGLYDDNGVFDPEKFDSWFSTWDKDHDGALNLKELAHRLYKEQDLFDIFGIFASGGEFGALYLIASQDGKVSKERMLALYQGRLFYDLAHDHGVPNCLGLQ